MSQIQSWHTAPPGAVTALGTLWVMFREYKALHGPMDGRVFRARAARAGRAWVAHRMNLTQPSAPDAVEFVVGTDMWLMMCACSASSDPLY